MAQEHEDWLWQVVLDGCDPEVYTWCMDELYCNEGRGDPRVRLWSHDTRPEQRKMEYRPAVIFNQHMDRMTKWHPDAAFCWLSDDDLLHPKYLQALSHALRGGKDVVHCGYRVTEERCGEHMFKCVVGSNKVWGKDDDPLGTLDSGCILQTARSFRELEHPAVPEGWDTGNHCDGLYLRKLACKFGIHGINQTLFTKRQTRVSTHVRPNL